MNKQGQNIAAIGREIDRHLGGLKNFAFGMYGGKHCKKPQRIHIHLENKYNVKSVRMDNTRCTCGGHTFSTLMDGVKVVCRHCGKVYLKQDFESLPKDPLTRAEKEDRHIFALLLAGGDLREDRERDVLVLKDRLGLPEGDLPLSYADHFANTYREACVVRSMLAATKEERVEMVRAQALSV